jgi:Cu/Ag efflux protein CusF
MKILCIALLLFTSSCAVTVAPNYNNGRSHNEQNRNRAKEINKFDKNSKKAMIKHRTKYSRGKRNKSRKSRKHNKYI